jgi:hypothetical protein
VFAQPTVCVLLQDQRNRAHIYIKTEDNGPTEGWTWCKKSTSTNDSLKMKDGTSMKYTTYTSWIFGDSLIHQNDSVTQIRLWRELEHLKIETRLIDESFEYVMSDCS